MGRKRETESAHQPISPSLLCLDRNNPPERSSSESSIISHFLCETFTKCRFESKLGEGDVRRTKMHIVLTRHAVHAHAVHFMYKYIHKTHDSFLINSTFSTILDVTRRLAWIPGYEWTMSYCPPTSQLVWFHPSLLIIPWLAVTIASCQWKAQSEHVGQYSASEAQEVTKLRHKEQQE